MKLADWLALAGYMCVTAGLSTFWPKHALPIALLCVGTVCIRLARAASPRKSLDTKRRRRREVPEIE